MSNLTELWREKAIMRRFFIEDLIEDTIEIANEEIVKHSIRCCFGQEVDSLNAVGLAIASKFHSIYIDHVEEQLWNLAIDALPDTFLDHQPEFWSRDKILDENVDLKYNGKPFGQAIYEGMIS